MPKISTKDSLTDLVSQITQPKPSNQPQPSDTSGGTQQVTTTQGQTVTLGANKPNNG